MKGNWFDLLVVAWLVLGAIRGLSNGLVRCGLRIAAFVVAVVALYPAALALGGRLADAAGLTDTAVAWLRRHEILIGDAMQLPADKAMEGIRDLLVSMNLPIARMPAASPGMTVEAYLAKLFLGFVLGGLLFLVATGIVYLVADAVASLLQGVLRWVPFFGWVNRLGGAALGAGEQAVVAAIVAGLVAPLLPLLPGTTGRLVQGSASIEPLLALFRALVQLSPL